MSAACNVSATPNLYNAMVYPYTVGPMALSAFLWSQGEANADSNTTAYYQCAFPLFVDAWRGAFAVPGAFFGFELLPAYIRDASFSPASLPYERQAQLAALALPGNVVTANGMDLGDPQAPHGSVHPRNKTAVAARFVAAALPLLYGIAGAYLNPAYLGAAAVTTGTTLTVRGGRGAARGGEGGLCAPPGRCGGGGGGTRSPRHRSPLVPRAPGRR